MEDASVARDCSCAAGPLMLHTLLLIDTQASMAR